MYSFSFSVSYFIKKRAADRYLHFVLQQAILLETSLFLSSLNIHDQHRDMRLDIDNMTYEVGTYLLKVKVSWKASANLMQFLVIVISFLVDCSIYLMLTATVIILFHEMVLLNTILGVAFPLQ